MTHLRAFFLKVLIFFLFMFGFPTLFDGSKGTTINSETHDPVTNYSNNITRDFPNLAVSISKRLLQGRKEREHNFSFVLHGVGR